MSVRNVYLIIYFCYKANQYQRKYYWKHEPVKRRDSEAGDEGEFGGAYFRRNSVMLMTWIK